MAQQMDWNTKARIAKKMTSEALIFAINDCLTCAENLGSADMMGKDASYYADEASIYRAELDKRNKRTKGGKR